MYQTNSKVEFINHLSQNRIADGSVLLTLAAQYQGEKSVVKNKKHIYSILVLVKELKSSIEIMKQDKIVSLGEILDIDEIQNQIYLKSDHKLLDSQKFQICFLAGNILFSFDTDLVKTNTDKIFFFNIPLQIDYLIKDKRINVEKQCIFLDAYFNERIKGKVVDVSIRGLSFKIPSQTNMFKKGDIIENISLELGNKNISVKQATVRNTKEDGQVGLEFTKIGKVQQTKLEREVKAESEEKTIISKLKEEKPEVKENIIISLSVNPTILKLLKLTNAVQIEDYEQALQLIDKEFIEEIVFDISHPKWMKWQGILLLGTKKEIPIALITATVKKQQIKGITEILRRTGVVIKRVILY